MSVFQGSFCQKVQSDGVRCRYEGWVCAPKRREAYKLGREDRGSARQEPYAWANTRYVHPANWPPRTWRPPVAGVA
jgi:hypothetical protein